MNRKNSIGFRGGSLLSALCSRLSALSSLRFALHSSLFLRCFSLSALCTMLFAFFTLLFALSSLPSAALAADKLVVKDSEGNIKFIVNDNGVGFGTTSPVSHLNTVDEVTVATRGLVVSQHTNFIDAPLIVLRKSRGTNAAPLTVQNGDGNGFFGTQSFDGTGWHYTAGVAFMIDGPVSTGVLPTKIVFRTTPTMDDFMAGYDRMTINSSGDVGIGVYPSHPLHMADGAYEESGQWINGSSRVYKENVNDLTAEEAMLAFNKLDPVTFNYKTNKDKKNVGFIAEDVPDLVATKDRKGLSAMDIVALLTRVVQEQQKIISELSVKIEGLEKQVRK